MDSGRYCIQDYLSSNQHKISERLVFYNWFDNGINFKRVRLFYPRSFEIDPQQIYRGRGQVFMLDGWEIQLYMISLSLSHSHSLTHSLSIIVYNCASHLSIGHKTLTLIGLWCVLCGHFKQVMFETLGSWLIYAQKFLRYYINYSC